MALWVNGESCGSSCYMAGREEGREGGGRRNKKEEGRMKERGEREGGRAWVTLVM